MPRKRKEIWAFLSTHLHPSLLHPHSPGAADSLGTRAVGICGGSQGSSHLLPSVAAAPAPWHLLLILTGPVPEGHTAEAVPPLLATPWGLRGTGGLGEGGLVLFLRAEPKRAVALPSFLIAGPQAGTSPQWQRRAWRRPAERPLSHVFRFPCRRSQGQQNAGLDLTLTCWTPRSVRLPHEAAISPSVPFGFGSKQAFHHCPLSPQK